MINALKMTLPHGIKNFNSFLITSLFILLALSFIELSCSSRRELVWPELDQLLCDEDDARTVSTPYTAAVLEYRVVFYDPMDAPLEDKNWSNANGHTIYDAQHPCRYTRIVFSDILVAILFSILL